MSRPDVACSAVAFLSFATLGESAGISVVSMWTGMMSFWCSSCFVTKGLKLWKVHLQGNSPSPSSTQYSHHIVATKEVISEDVVSWMLLSSFICWLEAGSQYGLSLHSPGHIDEDTWVQIQLTEVLSQCWHSAVQFLSGFWIQRWLAYHPGQELVLAPFWMHLTACTMPGLDLSKYAMISAFVISFWNNSNAACCKPAQM